MFNINCSLVADFLGYNIYCSCNNLQSVDFHTSLSKHNVSLASAEHSQRVWRCGQSGHHHADEQDVRELSLPSHLLGFVLTAIPNTQTYVVTTYLYNETEPTVLSTAFVF